MSSDPIGTGKGPGSEDNAEDGICLLHNCTEDMHCGGCSNGRTTCLVEERRCVACGEGGEGCPEGQECSAWGNCIPEGLTCPTDSHGDPQFECVADADCLACDPMHQICDPVSMRCVACTGDNTSACQSTDQCINNMCEANCPTSCNMDSDCGQCGGPGNEAHACNGHKCAECSPSVPCPNGETCSPQGVCLPTCGSDGKGACTSDASCASCSGGNTKCHKPIGSPNGECGPQADGCSDLGNGVAVLPEPFDQVTNLCSNDGDCNGVGVTINVGEMLRNLTGFDEIGDANIEYPMNVCADVSLGNISCGVCVPCQVDSDCQDISIDQVAGEAFGPLGSLAAALLLDLVFGPNDHEINMFCQPVAGGYGVCAPCPGIIYECGYGEGGGGGGSGSCSHDVCDVGGPLTSSCGSCEADMCSYDPYCCDTEWDDLCVSEAEYICALDCSGGGGGGGGGCHDECYEGDAMTPSCSPCVDAICDYDAYCCDTEWDYVCVGYVDQFCSPPC